MCVPPFSLSFSPTRDVAIQQKKKKSTRTESGGRWVGKDGFECSPLSTRDLPPRFVAVSSTQSDSLLDDDENENEEDFKQGGKM